MISGTKKNIFILSHFWLNILPFGSTNTAKDGNVTEKVEYLQKP